MIASQRIKTAFDGYIQEDHACPSNFLSDFVSPLLFFILVSIVNSFQSILPKIRRLKFAE